MFPAIKEIIQLIKSNSEEKFLIAHRKTECIRTGRTINNLLGYFEIFRNLVDLIFVQVGKRLNISSSIAIFTKISQDKFSTIGGAGNKKTTSFCLSVKMQHPGPNLDICKGS